MRTAAILPVKRFARAKQRLGVSVAEPLRVKLASAMLADVLLALAQTESIDRTIVVTREHTFAGAARERGAVLLDDDAEAGQSAAASLGVRAALAAGIDRVLCVPGDCPAVDPGELEALLSADARRAREGARVVIVPDRHGTGTNGLLLRPPDAIAPSFGPDSCERHLALARRAGVACNVEPIPSLLLDVDTGEDLAALRERLLADRPPARGAARTARGERTRAVLGQLEHTHSPSLARTA